MKLFKFIFCLFFLPLHINAQTTPFESEQMRFDAMTQSDTLALARLLNDDLSYMHSNGLEETKQDFIKTVATQKIIYQSITIEKHQGKIYRKNATITGICIVKGLYKGTPFEIKLRYLSFYTKKKRYWKLSAWQSLKIQ
jgi:ketosteroid isomerase-like protein